MQTQVKSILVPWSQYSLILLYNKLRMCTQSTGLHCMMYSTLQLYLIYLYCAGMGLGQTTRLRYPLKCDWLYFDNTHHSDTTPSSSLPISLSSSFFPYPPTPSLSLSLKIHVPLLHSILTCTPYLLYCSCIASILSLSVFFVNFKWDDSNLSLNCSFCEGDTIES